MIPSYIQSPHLAITHLLRSQGCCSDSPSQPSPNLQLLKSEKQFLQNDLSILKQRMFDYPCAVRLQQQVTQLEQLAIGLRHQNEYRRQQGWIQIEKVSNALSTQSTDFLQQQSGKISQQIAAYKSQYRRLDQQYQHLMLKVRKIHEFNQGIVNKYGTRYA